MMEISSIIESGMERSGRKRKILTFYSYKGGTGRSMALANVAWMLALNNKRVLVIDWDLEAPGVHRYFHPFLEDKELQSSRGLIDFVEDLAARQAACSEPLADTEADISSYVIALNRDGWDWSDFGDRAGIDLLPAGQQSVGYSIKVNSFNWISFYQSLGGRRFLAYMAAQVRNVYDYILIDSRTGVSDTSGICTVEMPDLVVVCFTLNEQSIRGAANVCESMMNQRSARKEAPGSEDVAATSTSDPFRIYPIPTRIENSENKKKQIAMSLIKKTFSRYLGDLSPADQNSYWGGLQMAYVPVYAFEEVPAIFGDSPDDQLSISPFIARLTRTLAQDEGISLKALPESLRLRVLDWYQRPSEIGEDAAQMAESEYRQLPQDLQWKATQVLLRLIQFTPEGITPQVLNRGDLQRGLSQSTDALVKAQVLKPVPSLSREALQLSDPSILQNWKAYQEWITNDLKFLQWRQSVNTAARSWRIAEKRQSDLLHGDSLEEAKRYLHDRADELNDDERDFISESEDRDEMQREIDAKSRANRDDLERQLKLLEEVVASKKQAAPIARWYRSPFLLMALLLTFIAATAMYFVYQLRERDLKQAELEQAYDARQTEANNMIQQLAAQNKALSDKVMVPQLPAASSKALPLGSVRPTATKPVQVQKPSQVISEPNASTYNPNATNSTPVCHIASGNTVWTLPGEILISLDGKPIGSFSVAKDGNEGLDFGCTPGTHRIEMLFVQPTTTGAPSYSCLTGITVPRTGSSFAPRLFINNGSVTCSLTPLSGSGSITK